ncbi:MAG: TlyA family RNA methyltransferase [Chloroflexota bacterium]
MSERKVRLDVLLVDRGLAQSRERAQALILAGDVKVSNQAVFRPSATVPFDAEVEVVSPPPYVSRGGFKLAHALDQFGVSVDGLTMLDVGASTGGFTDVLLKRGARKVYAVDVGRGQLAWQLRQDPRVVTMERVNVRYLESLPEPIDAAVVDVSFISLKLALAPIERLIGPSGWIVALVKPQFEAGRSEVGKGGVVRNPEVHRSVLVGVLTWAQGQGLRIGGCTPSPILGPAGNREFLILLRLAGPGETVDAAVQACLGDG